VRVERTDGVATITIDRPPVNAMGRAVVEALESTLDALATDATTRVAVLRGAGPRGFSAGADISEFPALLEPNADTRGEGIQRLADRVEAFPKPLIVAIHGFCMGGALEIALACDIRIAAEDARIGLPEIRIGILPGGGGTQRLPRVIGPGRARLMIFGGEPVTGRRALEWGLVEDAVPSAEVFDTAAAIARTLAAQSPHALAVIKALLRETSGAPLRDGLRTETAALARLLAHPDAREGIGAFLAKRAPRWAALAGGDADA
jgi:enoyl-CoA hydratase/carnithine racemase